MCCYEIRTWVFHSNYSDVDFPYANLRIYRNIPHSICDGLNFGSFFPFLSSTRTSRPIRACCAYGHDNAQGRRTTLFRSIPNYFLFPSRRLTLRDRTGTVTSRSGGATMSAATIMATVASLPEPVSPGRSHPP